MAPRLLWIFASPLAGILQAMLVAVWKEWRATYPEQFPEPQEEVYEVIEENVADKPLDPPGTMTSPTSLKQ